MKFVPFFMFVVIFCFSGRADAQIGWTKQEIVGVIGKSVGSIETRLVDSEGKADLFVDKDNDWELIVEYKEGVAWVVIFHGRSVRKGKAESLVALNCGPNVQDSKFLSGRYWIEKKKGLRAFYYTSPKTMLVVMTDKSLKSERKPRADLLKALPNVLPPKVGSKGDALSGTKNDPLSKYSRGNSAPAEEVKEEPEETPKQSENLNP